MSLQELIFWLYSAAWARRILRNVGLWNIAVYGRSVVKIFLLTVQWRLGYKLLFEIDPCKSLLLGLVSTKAGNRNHL